MGGGLASTKKAEVPTRIPALRLRLAASLAVCILVLRELLESFATVAAGVRICEASRK